MSLQSEFSYYLDHQQELAKKHEGRYLIIHGQKVAGSYEDIDEALEGALKDKGYALGEFLLQRCSSDPESTVHIFHSRVMFAEQ